MLLKSSVIGKEAHARPPLYLSYKLGLLPSMVYRGALCEAMHGEHHHHKFSKLQPLTKRL